jgi:hypothetical protein
VVSKVNIFYDSLSTYSQVERGQSAHAHRHIHTHTHTHTHKHARKFNIILFLRNERGMSKIQSKTRVLQADAALLNGSRMAVRKCQTCLNYCCRNFHLTMYIHSVSSLIQFSELFV